MKLITNKKKSIRLIVLILSVLLILPLTGCRADSEQDVYSQKKVEDGRTPITVLVKYAFSINNFEKAVESKFPDIDIVQIGNYTSNMGVTEYESRMEHGDLTDIVMTWPIEAGEEYCDERLMDLSGMDFTNRYQLSMLDNISRDGKLYYLPGPSQVRGILYNKTLFEEKGWEVPKDFEGFIQLCKSIEASGIRSLQLGFENSEVLDTAFIGYNYSDYFSKPQDSQWIENYNNGNGSFGEHFDGAFDVFQRMIDEGIFKPSDLTVSYADRERMLENRQCAMVEDSALLIHMMDEQSKYNDEFGMMPFFNPSEESDWARVYMVCYIGLNKELEKRQNKEKYDLVMKLMDYISTPEGQKALSADTGAMFSSLIGVPPPEAPEIKELIPALGSGRYAVFQPFRNVQDSFREGLAGMLKGEITKTEAMEAIDRQNLSPPIKTPAEKLGTATSRFTLIETGNFITDALREWSGCELALFLDNGKDGKFNGKGVSARIYEGDVTTLDIERIFPDLKYGEKGVVCKVSMSGENLINTLEYAIPIDNNVTGWFYYFSGLNMKFDPTAAPGKRIKEITTADGTPIDKDRLYTIAVMDGTVPTGYLKSHEETDMSIITLMEEYVRELEIISPSGDNRFEISN